MTHASTQQDAQTGFQTGFQITFEYPHATTFVRAGAGTNGRFTACAPFDQLLGSWNAETPEGSSVELQVRVLGQDDSWSRWFSFGEWSLPGRNASVENQKDDLGEFDTDTLTLNEAALTFEFRVALTGDARLTLLSFTTSLKAGHALGLGTPGHPEWWNVTLNVPAHSQMIHEGGDVWCSPAALRMILAAHGHTVSMKSAVTGTYDDTWEGTGNWSYNAAYAGTFGLRAHLLRLPHLAEAETFIARGIPLALSLGWKEGELPGAPIPKSAGHLMVLVGFDSQGNPVLNDPASPDDAGVQRTYPRADFERQWLTRSGGLTYLLTPNQQ